MLVTPMGRVLFLGGLFELLSLLSFFINNMQIVMVPALQWCGEK